MALAEMEKQFEEMISSMIQEGFLNDYFLTVQKLEDNSCPGFLVKVIKMFCEHTEQYLNKLIAVMNQEKIDYHYVDDNVRRIKDKALVIGAPKLTAACVEFKQYREQNNKEGCMRALSKIKDDYYCLRAKFEGMMQLRKRIQISEGK